MSRQSTQHVLFPTPHPLSPRKMREKEVGQRADVMCFSGNFLASLESPWSGAASRWQHSNSMFTLPPLSFCRRVTLSPIQTSLACILSLVTHSGDLDSDALRAVRHSALCKSQLQWQNKVRDVCWTINRPSVFDTSWTTRSFTSRH